MESSPLTYRICASARLKQAVQALGLFFAFLLINTPTYSQVNLGRINGTVSDQSGGVISSATVIVLDEARGVPRTLTTDDAGAYSAPALIPGTYTVRVESKGFSTFERKGIEVGVGQEIRIDVSLQPGEQSQLVTVTSELPEVNTTNAQLGGTIANQTITDLPVEGRTFISLANYQPGTMSKPGGGGGLVQYTNGMRPDYTVYVFDGIMDVNSFGTAGPLNLGYQAGGPDESVIVSVDAIQEINFVETPKAEYGWRPGASENVGLKSGTNTIHGTAFAIGRDTGMDARNPFAFSGNPPVPSPAPVEYIQYGATIDGPIKKDKLFYLLNYEGVTYDVGNPKNFTMPTLVSLGGPTVKGATAGSFPDAIAAMNAAGVKISPLSLKLAGCTAAGVCTANAGLFSNTLPTTTYATDFLDVGNSRNGIAKIDYHMNDKNNFNLDYFQGYGHIIAPVGNVTQPYWSTPIIGSVTVGRAVWSYVPNSSVVNEVRAGWDYSLQAANPFADCSPSAGAPNYASLGFVSGVSTPCAFPTVTINGFGILGEPEGVSYKCITYSFLDNLSITKGDHQIKMGFQYSHLIFDAIPSVNLLKGTVQFNAAALAGSPGIPAASATSLEAFLNGDIFSEAIEIGNLRRTGTFDQMATYIQDDWRVVPRLTLNLGLRWELTTPITTQNNQMAIFNPSVPGGLQQEANNTLYREPVAFGPRFGLAWDVFGKGTTVVHSGFSVMYYEPTAADFMNATTAALGTNPTGGSYQTVAGGPLTPFGGTINVQNKSLTAPFAPWAQNSPVFNAAALAPTCGPASPNSPCKAYGVSRLTVPQFLEWNFGIQHAFTGSTTLEVAYVGNHGQHQEQLLDINQAAPGPSGAAAEQLRRPYYGQFPYFSNIDILSNPARSNYNGLQVKLTQRVAHGLTFDASYAYAHAFDSETSETALGVPENSLNPQGDYGNASLDIRHRFTVQGTYQVPGVKAPLHILEGWQVTTAVQILSALPFNALDTGDDISGTGEGVDRWDLLGKASDFKANGVTPFPYFSGASNPACVAAAATLPNGPVAGETGIASLTKYGCYAEGSSMILPPAQGTFGTMERFGLRGTGFRVWDMVLAKNIPLKERFTAQFRVECYNVLNTIQYATPNTNPATPSTFGAASGTPNIIANSPIIGSGDARRFQLGLKFTF